METCHFLTYAPSFHLFRGASEEGIEKTIEEVPPGKKIALVVIAGDSSIAIRSFHGVDLKTYSPLYLQEMITRPFLANVSTDYSLIGAIVFDEGQFKYAIKQTSSLLELKERKIDLLMIIAHGDREGIMLTDSEPSKRLSSKDLMRDEDEYRSLFAKLDTRAITALFACSTGQDIEGGFAKTLSKLCGGRLVIAPPLTATAPFYTKMNPLSLLYFPFCFATDGGDRKRLQINAHYFREGELIGEIEEPSTDRFWRACSPDTREVYLRRKAYFDLKALPAKL